MNPETRSCSALLLPHPVFSPGAVPPPVSLRDALPGFTLPVLSSPKADTVALSRSRGAYLYIERGAVRARVRADMVCRGKVRLTPWAL